MERSPSGTKKRTFVAPLHAFLKREESSGAFLAVTTIAALVWVNTLGVAHYHNWWATPIELLVGRFREELTLHDLINDFVMAVFFFTVGLEIKRELVVGELSSVRKATAPVIAAIGGILAPAALYVAINQGSPSMSGWAVPTATDIAFALGVLALLGNRVPAGLRAFLAALAIVDDIAAVLMIALFYGHGINPGPLLLAAAVFASMLVLGALRVRALMAYAVLTLLLWVFVRESGLHATVAGVLGAMTVPVRARIDSGKFLKDARSLLVGFEQNASEDKTGVISESQNTALHELDDLVEGVSTPLHRCLYILHPWVAYGAMPLFALANAGLPVTAELIGDLNSPVALGIVFGLLIGKPAGILLATFLAVKVKVADVPDGADWWQLAGVACIAGIGFTMSLFISNLAFTTPGLHTQAKAGIMSGSLVAAALGCFILAVRSRRA